MTPSDSSSGRKGICVFFGGIGFFFTDRYRQRHQQRLATNGILGVAAFQVLIGDPFMCCMHVNENQAVCIFRQDVNTV